MSRQLTDGHKQTENPVVWARYTTSTASTLLENLIAIILVFMVRNTSIKKASIYLVYVCR